MRDAARWGMVIAVVLLLIGPAAYARGPGRHRGDEIGTHGTRFVVVGTDDE